MASLIELDGAAPVNGEDDRQAGPRESSQQEDGAPQSKWPPPGFLSHVLVIQEPKGHPCAAAREAPGVSFE